MEPPPPLKSHKIHELTSKMNLKTTDDEFVVAHNRIYVHFNKRATWKWEFVEKNSEQYQYSFHVGATLGPSAATIGALCNSVGWPVSNPNNWDLRDNFVSKGLNLGASQSLEVQQQSIARAKNPRDCDFFIAVLSVKDLPGFLFAFLWGRLWGHRLF